MCSVSCPLPLGLIGMIVSLVLVILLSLALWRLARKLRKPQRVEITIIGKNPRGCLIEVEP